MSYYDYDYTVDWEDAKELNDLFFGKRIIDVVGSSLILDDGTELEVVGNEGCSCGAGEYQLTSLAKCDNVITKVDVDVEGERDEYDDYWAEDTVYKLFVYADNQAINVATVEGSDGNGYYGTGFSIRVKKNESTTGTAT